MSEILVRRPGLLTTVQDLGRPGLGRFGVSACGAMDPLALRVANLLVGNPEGAPGLEITAVGPELELLSSVTFALTGANLSASLGGEPLEPWQSHHGVGGDVLRFGARRSGARCYLAVAGGLAVPAVLGSASTDLEGGIGGVDGAPLRAGQRLVLGPTAPCRPRAASVAVLRAYANPFELRFVPEAGDAARDAAVRSFTAGAYRVSRHSNRMGYRLEGPQVTVATVREPVSEPIPPGTIQVPGGGQPILLMADRPTVGGYTRVGQVIRADIPKAAQLWVGHPVRFRPVGIAEARRALDEQEAMMAEVVS